VRGYESIVAGALMGRTTPEQAADEVELLYAVQRACVCRCGQVLDVRRAHVLRAILPGETEPRFVGVYCRSCAIAGASEVKIPDGVTLSYNPPLPPPRKERKAHGTVSVITGEGTAIAEMRSPRVVPGLCLARLPDQDWTVTHIGSGRSAFRGSLAACSRVLRAVKAAGVVCTVPESDPTFRAGLLAVLRGLA